MIDEKKLIDEVNDLMDANLLFYDDASKSRQETLDEIVDLIDEQPKVNGWIPVEERLPEERESSFAKLKGTDKWIEGMFEKKSDDVNVTIEFSDGKRKVITTKIIDGQWNKHTILKPIKFIAWQPLPEPYEVKGNE